MSNHNCKTRHYIFPMSYIRFLPNLRGLNKITKSVKSANVKQIKTNKINKTAIKRTLKIFPIN